MTEKLDEIPSEIENGKWIYFPREKYKDCAVIELDYGEWIFKRGECVTKGQFKDILGEIVDHILEQDGCKCINKDE